MVVYGFLLFRGLICNQRRPSAQGKFQISDLIFKRQDPIEISDFRSQISDSALLSPNLKFEISDLRSSLRLPQFLRLFGGSAHGADQRAAQFSFFKFAQAFDGRAARTGNHVL